MAIVLQSLVGGVVGFGRQYHREMVAVEVTGES
jgi:hypothetical protein